jgi:ATP-dependent Clp protease ATP-binding subunit ClpA
MIDESPRAAGGALARFTRDLTSEARAGRLEPVRAREDEIARLVDILLRQGKSNPALVGPAGVGKTAIVEGLAQRVAAGGVPLALRDVRLLSLDHVSLLAGSTYRGQYEERIRALVAETQAAPDVILFIDELHNLIGQGTAMGTAMDAANMLKPALARGDFRVIGATTDEEYGHWVLGDPALERRFQKVEVRELSVEAALDVLRARQHRLERHHSVLISDDAIVAAVRLTDAHVRDRRRPDKAIDALDEACAHLQAVTVYAPRTEVLLKLRRAATAKAHAARDPRREPDADEDLIDPIDSIAAALGRFGAGLERVLAESERTEHAPPPPPPSAPRAAPMTPAGPTLAGAALDAEIARRLMGDGVVVRGHDVARVVALMSGGPVTWG